MARERILADLRALVAHVEARGRATQAALPFSLERIDSHLPGGGLTLGALHEVAGGASIAEQGAAALFAAGIAARLTGPVLWCLRSRDLFAPALQAVGLDLDRVIFAEAPDAAAVLAVMEEGLRHAGLAIVVGEVPRLPLVASRRLQLAAERSGVTALALLRWQKTSAVQPSASVSRWRVTPLPSETLAVPSLARPRWRVALERCRGAAPNAWNLEACDETGRLGLSPDLAHRSPATAARTAAA